MSRFPHYLPAAAIEILDGQSKAKDVAENLFASYWLFGHSKGTSLFLLQQAHADLADLAKAMGYTLTPTDALHVKTLKAQWAGICNAMNAGYWRGTEAEALAEIERIKSEIAKMESAA
jgi:hypothetical protein